MKRDWQEWFANAWNETEMVYVFTVSCGNGMGMEPVERDETGFHFHSRVPLYRKPCSVPRSMHPHYRGITDIPIPMQLSSTNQTRGLTIQQ